MTQVAFVRKADIPSKKEIEEHIQGLRYDFKFLEEFDIIWTGGFSCLINGQETFFETYSDKPTEIIGDHEWIKPDITSNEFHFLGC